MILYRWQGRPRNFGDELNTLLWPRLLPDFFDGDASVQLLGIGSVLDARHEVHVLKVVAGAGYGGYQAPPTLDRNWLIHWVRGPRTAQILGLPQRLGVGDPAMLLSLTAIGGEPPAASEPRVVGFMPHFESMERGAWAEAAALAGLTLIDPRGEPEGIVHAIRRCRVLLSEALHGAVVADALRVPWVAIQPLASIHRAKWHDWADTLGLKITFRQVRPSSLLEHATFSGLYGYRMGRAWVGRHSDQLRRFMRRWYVERAARALLAAAAAPPQVSDEFMLQEAQSRMMDAIAVLRRDPLRGYMRQPQRAPGLTRAVPALAK